MNIYEQVLFLWFCVHSNQEGTCYPSVGTLAKETGMSRAKIFTVIASLEEKKIIQRSGELGRVNDYRILIEDPSTTKTPPVHEVDTPRPPDRRVPVHEVDTELNTIELNTRTKSNNPNRAVDSQAHQPTPSEEAKEFFDSPSKQSLVIQQITSKGYNHEIIRDEVSKFVLYWTEPSKNGRRLRWELERTFEVRRRLVTWLTRATGQRRSFQPKPSQRWTTI